MKNIISTFAFSVKVKTAGNFQIIAKALNPLKRGEELPASQSEGFYLVNAFVFEANKATRKDLAMIDPEKTIRFESGHKLEGKTNYVTGFIYSTC